MRVQRWRGRANDCHGSTRCCCSPSAAQRSRRSPLIRGRPQTDATATATRILYDDVVKGFAHGNFVFEEAPNKVNGGRSTSATTEAWLREAIRKTTERTREVTYRDGSWLWSVERMPEQPRVWRFSVMQR